MSKHTITHLKAPWPHGAKIGDVVEFEVVPVWAAGKFAAAADDAEVTLSFDKKEEIIANVVPDQALLAQVAELQSKLESTQAALASSEGALAAAQADGVALREQLESTQAALAASSKKAGK